MSPWWLLLLMVPAYVLGWNLGRNHTYNVVKVFLGELAGYVSKEPCFCYHWRTKTGRAESCLACRAKEFTKAVMQESVSEPPARV